MKPSQTKNYSVLFLKAAQKGNTEESWPTILHNAYLFSKDIVTWFPLHRDLIERIDRIFDRIVADLGTKYLGVWYLPNPHERDISELMRDATHFITDDGSILRLSFTCRKPCIYFKRQIKRMVFISNNNNDQQIWAESLGFEPAEIVYYRHGFRYGGCGRLLRYRHTPQPKSYLSSEIL